MHEPTAAIGSLIGNDYAREAQRISKRGAAIATAHAWRMNTGPASNNAAGPPGEIQAQRISESPRSASQQFPTYVRPMRQ